VTAHAGYSAGFLTLAGCAAVGAALFLVAMPETAAPGESESASTDESSGMNTTRLSLAPHGLD